MENSSKKAFVMMAYDQEYNRVYSIVIKPALERLGYECIRQDQAGAGGYIMQNVIRNIAEADVVIADLSAWKFNVAYELGIRHSLSRNGTILICADNQKTSAQFDVQHLDVMFYDSSWMNNFGEETIINELTKRIQVIESKGNTLVDSPVHSIYTALPDNVIRMEASVSSDQADRIAELELENSRLKERLENAGLDESSEMSAREDYRGKIMQAIKERIYYSDAAVEQLDQLSRSGDIDAFGDFLANVMEHGYLDEYDCNSVYNCCNRLKAPMLTKIFLEYATKEYPDNEELNLRFAELLAKSYQTREKALKITNEMIGLSRHNGIYEISKRVSKNTLVAFYNVYLELKKYDEIVKISKVFLQKYETQDFQCLIYRNIVTACNNLGDRAAGEQACRELMRLNPELDTNYYSCYRYFLYSDQLPKAYEAMENTLHFDPNYESYYYYMAGFILDYSMVRADPGDAPHTVDTATARRAAIPFVLAALRLPQASTSRAQSFLMRNGFDDVLKALSGNGTLGNYDMSIVDDILNKRITPLFD